MQQKYLHNDAHDGPVEEGAVAGLLEQPHRDGLLFFVVPKNMAISWKLCLKCYFFFRHTYSWHRPWRDWWDWPRWAPARRLFRTRKSASPERPLPGKRFFFSIFYDYSQLFFPFLFSSLQMLDVQAAALLISIIWILRAPGESLWLVEKRGQGK